MKNKLSVYPVVIVSTLMLFLSAASYALPAPSNLSARANPDKNLVILNWNPIANAAGYNVYRKESGDLAYQRLNFSPIADLSYEDKGVSKGKDYLYTVRSLDRGGRESADSISVGAPLMSINTSATVTTLRDKPLETRSIRTGRAVTFAAPGDIITYRISYTNLGFSSARNVRIDYDIPEGTIIAGVPKISKGVPVKIIYFDRAQKKWLAQIDKEENVSRVRFTLLEDVLPVSNKVSGLIDLNVLIAL